MFYIAINHKNINDSKSLVNIIFFKLLPFCDLIIDIGSILKIIEIYFNIPLAFLPPLFFIYNGEKEIRVAYHTMKTKEYYDYTNIQYKEYCNILHSGNRDLQQDFINAITKVRREKYPEEVLTFNDIFAIKRMGSIYGYNEEVSKLLMGLSNERDFQRGNHPSYAWSSRSKVWLKVVEELEAVNNKHTIKVKEAALIKEKLKIENVLN